MCLASRRATRFWHYDTIYAMDRVYQGESDGSVLCILVGSWTVENQAYIEQQREVGRRGARWTIFQWELGGRFRGIV